MSILTSTTPQAVSRFLRANGYGVAMKNKGVTCHAGPQGTVTVYIYPGSVERLVSALSAGGYAANPGHRCAVVKGRVSQ